MFKEINNNKMEMMKLKTGVFFLFLLPALTFGQVNEWAEDNDTNKDEAILKKQETIIGRWDITIEMDGQERPSWLEVSRSGFKTLVGRFVGMEGSARPIAEIHFIDGVMSFSIPPQWSQEPNDLQVFGKRKGDKLVGSIKMPNGKKYKWTGTRAPLLKRSGKPKWGKPIHLISKKDLSQWKATGEDNQWVIEDGILKSPHSGSNLYTEKKFRDFKLHVEVKYPKGSNSGVYLRGRHEVQVVDSAGAKSPSTIILGAIYGFIAPSKLVAKPAGEWQSLDITLIGRKVNVDLNGKNIICDRIIPGITGGAMDSKEGEPGPILLQGDHGPVQYKNMVITPAK